MAETRPCYTADGVLIVEGLRVFTNNMDRGIVTGKTRAGDYDKEGDLWFEVHVDTSYKGTPMENFQDFNGERLATRFEGKQA